MQDANLTEVDSSPRVVSIQVGAVRVIDDGGGPGQRGTSWETGFFKEPIDEAVAANSLGLAGDEVADTVNHGGVDKAILCYASDHYEVWATELPDAEFGHGAFGENLTIAGLDELSVCIGDVWQVGSTEIEVSQPRQPCWKLGRRHMRADLPKRVVKSGRTGWYVRVTSDGEISVGDALTLRHRPFPEWTVQRLNEVRYHRTRDEGALADLRRLAPLAQAWRSDRGLDD